MHLRLSSIDKSTVLAVTAIGLGIGAGFGVKNMLGREIITDYSSLQVTGMDTKPLLERYNELVEDKTDDLASHFTYAELINLSFALFYQSDNYFVVSSGKAFANAIIVVEQNIRSSFIKNTSDYFEESLTASTFVQDASRAYLDNGSITRYLGKPNGELDGGDYKESEHMSVPDYLSMMGRNVNSVTNYIFNEQTVLKTTDNSGLGTSSLTRNNDNTYTLELELDPILSVVNYVKQMKTTGGLSSYPSFDFVHLTVTLDDMLNIVSITNSENYRANMGAISAALSSSITSYYFTDNNVKIPTIDQCVPYEEYL